MSMDYAAVANVTKALATIAQGAALSGAFDMNGFLPKFIHVPADMTNSALEFQTTTDNGATWVKLRRSNGSPYALTIDKAGGVYELPANLFAGLLGLKVEVDNAEAALRNLTIIGWKAG